jgi:hypothetical protein
MLAVAAAVGIAILLLPTGQSILDRTQEVATTYRHDPACAASLSQEGHVDGLWLAIRKVRPDWVLFTYGFDNSTLVSSWSVDSLQVNCVDAVAEPTSYSPVAPDNVVAPFDVSPGLPHYVNHTAPGTGQRVTLALTYQILDGSFTLVTRHATLDVALSQDVHDLTGQAAFESPSLGPASAITPPTLAFGADPLAGALSL